MPKGKSRRFSREFKLSALSRMAAGENVSALSRALNFRRKLLYEWRDAFRSGGEEALRGPGRPPRGTLVLGAKRGGVGGIARGAAWSSAGRTCCGAAPDFGP